MNEKKNMEFRENEMRDENELRKKINEMMKNGVGESRNHSV